ncbi:MAG: NYN domain-containing protein [Devosia sp.]
MAKRIAVLIDGDNFHSDLADLLFEEVGNLGKATIKRVFGDTHHVNGWREAARRHSIALRELLPGKNAADMALAIDAMDILHQGKIDGFCIASSDSDFASLATRLREDGVAVRGFGNDTAAQAFRSACDEFVILGRGGAFATASPTLTVTANAATVGGGVNLAGATKLIGTAMQNMLAKGIRTTLPLLGQELHRLDKGYSAGRYEVKNLKSLVLLCGWQLVGDEDDPTVAPIPLLRVV